MDAAGYCGASRSRPTTQAAPPRCRGYLAAAEFLSVDVVPLVNDHPGAARSVTAQALKVRVDEMAQMLREHGPWDGVLATMRGAAVADSVDDVDGYLLARMHEVVGPDVPIGTSLDVHANISAGSMATSLTRS